MKLYFSGVRSRRELVMLRQAGVGHLLVDQFDIWRSGVLEAWDGHLALDSGSYRAYKRGLRLHAGAYRLVIRLLNSRRRRPFDFVVGLDVIGDPAQSRWNWIELTDRGVPTMPVWQWGAGESDLEFYLERAPVVGLGGLVQPMRDKDEAMLQRLTRLCEQHPGRFHIFGINWLRAINRLQPLLHSGDTSKWLDGARYRKLIFVHSRYHYLAEAPVRVLAKSMPGLAGYDRERLCVENARNMAQYAGCLPLPAAA
jgi:hypothetical protein